MLLEQTLSTPGFGLGLSAQVMSAQWYDANISLPGCDKNMPGTLMAMGRLNRPSLMVYGGTIKPGVSASGAPLDIVSAFQSYGESAAQMRGTSRTLLQRSASNAVWLDTNICRAKVFVCDQIARG